MSYQYRYFNYNDRTISRLSYLYNGNQYQGFILKRGPVAGGVVMGIILSYAPCNPRLDIYFPFEVLVKRKNSTKKRARWKPSETIWFIMVKLGNWCKSSDANLLRNWVVGTWSLVRPVWIMYNTNHTSGPMAWSCLSLGPSYAGKKSF